MRRNRFGDVLGNVYNITREAIDNLNELAGTSRDRELALYNQMKPIDFQRLTEIHGVEAVSRYIDEMETRRLKENYNGI